MHIGVQDVKEVGVIEGGGSRRRNEGEGEVEEEEADRRSSVRKSELLIM